MCLLFAATPHTVGVDLSALDRAGYQELDAVSLERALVVRLVQEGFAVLAPTSSPEIVVRLVRVGRTVELGVASETVRVALDPRHLREVHLEIAQKAADLARLVAAKLDERAAAAAAAAAQIQPPPSVPATAPRPADSVAPPPVADVERWNVLAGGGVLFRAPGLDPRFTLAARFAPTARVGVHLELALSPIPGNPLTVYDGAALLGVGLELVRASIFRAELGVSVGAAIHTFSLATVSAQERFGARVDFVARPFLRLVLNPVAHLLLWVQLGGGLGSAAREHRLLAVVLYSRGAPWVDAQGGLGWEL